MSSLRKGTLRLYWDLYGRTDALLRSPYLWISAFLVFPCDPIWRDFEHKFFWVEIAVSAIPSILGFTLGGMAILLAFSDKNFMDAIRESGSEKSLFMETVATFFHFVFLQTLAFITALLAVALQSTLLSCVGFLIFTYATLSGVAIASQLLQIARIFNALVSQGDD